jgi:hypothetical protein
MSLGAAVTGGPKVPIERGFGPEVGEVGTNGPGTGPFGLRPWSQIDATRGGLDVQQMLGVAGALVGAALLALALVTRRRTVAGGPTALEADVMPDVPPDAVVHAPASSLGHGLAEHQIIGAGVLWLNADDVGFVLDHPRRTFRIGLSAIDSVQIGRTFARPGIIEHSDAADLLSVQWYDVDGLESICFQVHDPTMWALAFDQALGHGSVAVPS